MAVYHRRNEKIMPGRFAACSLLTLILSAVAYGDEHFIRTQINGHLAYLISKEQAPAAMEWLKSGDESGILPPGDKRKVEGNWDLDEKIVAKADAQAFAFIRQGRTDYAFAFPEWAKVAKTDKDAAKREKDALNEVELVHRHLGDYLGQYFGYVIDGKRHIHCSYFDKNEVAFFEKVGTDPSSRFIVVNDGGYHLWQINYDVNSDSCSNLQINGPWALNW